MKIKMPLKKVCLVTFQDGQERIVDAPTFYKDNEQYVFPAEDSSEIQFVDAINVRGITIETLTPGRDGRGW
jgi:hypothetical protein